MQTATLPLTISKQRHDKVNIEVDRNRLERVVASLGLFTKDFIASLDRAEEDVQHGRVRAVRSLRSLR